MTTSTILPPSSPKPAEIAATPNQESATAADIAGTEGAPSFGQVLKSQMDKSAPEKTSGKTEGDGDESAMAPDGAAPAVVAMPAELGGQLAASSDVLRVAVDFSTLAARTIAVTAPGQQSGEGSPRVSVGSTGRAVASGKLAAAADVGADKAADTRDAGVQFGIDDTLARRAGPALRIPRDDATMVEKSTAFAVVATETPTSAVPAAGNADVRRTGDPAAMRLTVAQPLGATGWDEAVADRVTWLTQSRQPNAELHLNPPNLGPVEVHVSMQGDQTTVSFFSPHAPVREALQAATPRLSEAFAAAGLSLGNVSVGADSNSGRDTGRRDQGGQRRATEDDVVAVVGAASRWSSAVGGLRAVDLFA